MLVKLDGKDSQTVVNALIKHARKLPQELYKSLTWDRGTEMHAHKQFTMATDIQVIRQHLIDPEICIRCNTCEAICPVGAITHDSLNYVVKADICNLCMDCISPCPTGSIDNWRMMPKAKAYSIEEQLKWDELPGELSADELAQAGVEAGKLNFLPRHVLQTSRGNQRRGVAEQDQRRSSSTI